MTASASAPVPPAPSESAPAGAASALDGLDTPPQPEQALNTEASQRESRSVLVGGGLVIGVAAGAGIGVAVAGPVGAVVGGTLGGVAGALGAVAGTTAALAASGPGQPVHLHVEDTGGDGAPVLLIHGWPLSTLAFTAQCAALRQAGYRVIGYDRRGFGRSDKPESGYDYDTLADDLAQVLNDKDLHGVTLVGFSMGGGEVLRYVRRHGQERLRSVVLAAAVPPAMLQTPDNPEGPLSPEKLRHMKQSLAQDRAAFFDQFTRDFFSANGVLQVSEPLRSAAVTQCHQSAQTAALECIDAFACTDFRDDLQHLSVPTMVLHGDCDAIVPLPGSGLRTHYALPHSQLVIIAGGPHDMNVSHADAFNEALLAFLRR